MIDFDITFKPAPDQEELTTKSMKTVLMKSMFKMEELAVQNAPVDTGELRQKITVFPQVLSDEYVLSSKAEHSEAMEYGSRPFYAPIEPLKKWAARKIGDEGAAWAVRAAIAKNGVKAQPFMRPALFQVKSYWLGFYAKQEANKQ